MTIVEIVATMNMTKAEKRIILRFLDFELESFSCSISVIVAFSECK